MFFGLVRNLIFQGWFVLHIQAITVKSQGMMRNFDIQCFFNKFPYLFDPWISKLHYFAGFSVNKMIMFLEFVRPLKLGAIITKLMLGNQAAIQQQFDRIIQCSAADPVFVILHPDVKGLNIKVTVSIIYFLKDGKSFRRLPMAPLFEVIREDFLDRFK